MPKTEASDRRQLLLLVRFWAASRLAILLVLWLSPTLPISLGNPPSNFRSAVTRWDVGWFLGVAANGYQQLHETAFFPAFPMAVRCLSLGIGDLLVSALVLNAALSLASVFLLYFLVRHSRPADEAVVAACVVLFHPLSFYFSVPYTEALFLSLTLGAFLALAKDRWFLVAVCSAAAALTRNTGVLLAVPLLYHAIRKSRTSTRGLARLGAVSAALAPAVALGCYCLFTAVRFGEPFSFLTAQAFWKEHIALALPFEALVRDLGRWRGWLDHHLPLTLLGLWLAFRVMRSPERGFALLVAPSLLLSVSLSKLAITPRLHLVLFPLWIEAGVLLSRLPRPQRLGLAILGMVLGLWFGLEFSRGEWVD